jgi:hypothetical protein
MVRVIGVGDVAALIPKDHLAYDSTRQRGYRKVIGSAGGYIRDMGYGRPIWIKLPRGQDAACAIRDHDSALHIP